MRQMLCPRAQQDGAQQAPARRFGTEMGQTHRLCLNPHPALIAVIGGATTRPHPSPARRWPEPNR